MKKNRFGLSVLAASASLILSGCTIFDASLDLLLSAPKLNKEQAEIYNALSLSIGEQAELIYPKSGEFRNAFILYNIDDDEGEEALVFYREKIPNSETSGGLRINILDRKSGQWVSAADRSVSCTDIERISFYDFGSGTDIIVTGNFSGQAENSLNIFHYSEDRFEELYKASYSFMDISDLNDDGYDEVFLITFDPALNQYAANLLGESHDPEAEGFGLLTSQSIFVDSAVVQRLTRQKIKDGVSLLYLDYSQGENSYSTQVLFCRNDNLKPLFGGETLRKSNSDLPVLFSTDIDGDGLIEIPITNVLPGYESLTIPEQKYYVDWEVVDTETFNLSVKCSTYVSGGYEYIFYIPVRWQWLVTVQKTENNIVNFMEYSDGNIGRPLLSIQISKNPPTEEGWELFEDNENGIYVKSGEEENPLILTPDELKNSLSIITKRS